MVRVSENAVGLSPRSLREKKQNGKRAARNVQKEKGIYRLSRPKRAILR